MHQLFSLATLKAHPTKGDKQFTKNWDTPDSLLKWCTVHVVTLAAKKKKKKKKKREREREAWVHELAVARLSRRLKIGSSTDGYVAREGADASMDIAAWKQLSCILLYAHSKSTMNQTLMVAMVIGQRTPSNTKTGVLTAQPVGGGVGEAGVHVAFGEYMVGFGLQLLVCWQQLHSKNKKNNKLSNAKTHNGGIFFFSHKFNQRYFSLESAMETKSVLESGQARPSCIRSQQIRILLWKT